MDRKDFQIEICSNGLLSSIAAQEGGANRVELCAAIPEGGTTPSIGMIRQVRQAIGIGLNVIIRPRGGDFLYSQDEIDMMAYDIERAIDEGADGLVFGCLTRQGDIDMHAMEQLMQAANGHSVTFHRAFDRCRDPYLAIRDIEALGCHRILTSGQAPTAYLGIDLLAELNALGAAPLLMAGCGVNEDNIATIAQHTGIREFHFSARLPLASQMLYTNPNVYMGNPGEDEDTLLITSAERIKDTINQLL